MKKVLLVAVIAAAGFIVFFGIKNAWFTTYSFEITPDYTLEQIDSLTSDLKTKNITFEVKKINFDDAGNLTEIAANTNFGNGSSAYFSSKALKKVTIKKGLFASCEVNVENLN